MNGVHDMGGMHGFGPINREESPTLFHAPWEGRLGAMMGFLLRQRVFNLHEFRRAIESLPPAHYLTYTYYERWLAAVRILLEEKGTCTAEEINEACQRTAQERVGGASLAPARTEPATTSSIAQRPAEVPVQSPPRRAPRYRSGDQVVTKLMHPYGHTRLPRYARAKRGVIDRLHGFQAYPDTSAHGGGENPEPVYAVRFTARELWGETAAPKDAVYIDLWESYLDPV
jgi:nitrile hydratase